jgi:hypothetical protein
VFYLPRKPYTALRNTSGNVLPLVVALFIGVLLAILLFSMSMIRMIGSHQEQKTAIESAVLAVANDLSKIVVEDPHFGFISLSDAPPVGTATKAGDNYFLQCKSINTLLATIRLDMIVASELNNADLQRSAQLDYSYALQAQDHLLTTLKSAILPGGFGSDINGNIVVPCQDAVTAYDNNRVRMNGVQSSLVPGSMKLTLGWADGLTTNTQIPNPLRLAQLSSSQQENGFYRPFVDAPFAGYSFIFTALSNDSLLTDVNAFKSGAPNLKYSLPDIVKCDADQQFEYKDQYGNSQMQTTHIAGSAQPSCLIDHCPDPGALAVAFPNGTIPDIARLGDLLTNTNLMYSPIDLVQSPLSGDYPTFPLTQVVLPGTTDQHPNLGQGIDLAFYDWLRRQRTSLDIGSLVKTLNQPLAASLPSTAPQVHYFQTNTSGAVIETVLPDTPTIALPVSHKQYKVLSGLALRSVTNNFYDIILKDFVNQPGRPVGGIHAGEPFGGSNSTVAGGGSGLQMDENPLATMLFPTGPMGGAVRTTYQNLSTAVEVRFKQRKLILIPPPPP